MAFMRNHGDAVVAVVLLLTVALAFFVSLWPWGQRTAPSSVITDEQREEHALLWSAAAAAAQQKWLHSADDYCLWVMVKDSVLHIERIPGPDFAGRLPGAVVDGTLITSSEVHPEVMARMVAMPIGTGRDTSHGTLPELYAAGGVGNQTKLSPYEIRRLRGQLASANPLHG